MGEKVQNKHKRAVLITAVEVNEAKPSPRSMFFTWILYRDNESYIFLATRAFELDVANCNFLSDSNLTGFFFLSVIEVISFALNLNKFHPICCWFFFSFFFFFFFFEVSEIASSHISTPFFILCNLQHQSHLPCVQDVYNIFSWPTILCQCMWILSCMN